jgi:molybdate transport system substrate-binding protein
VTPAISGISSMATKAVLARLADAYLAQTGRNVAIESVGGIDAAQRVIAGEPFDVVVLARHAIDELLAGGHVAARSDVDLARSQVAVAVQAGARRPDVSSEADLERAVRAARTIGISTGPSGVGLRQLFGRWGIADVIGARIIKAPPGVPVGRLVARGDAELGFQQLSELVHLDGVDVLGPLPSAIQITTTFTAAVGSRARQPASARELIAFLAGPSAAAAKRQEGMEPA